MRPAGGIDLGGTKIEATLFDARHQPGKCQRIGTPANDYEAMVRALADQIHWLREEAEDPKLPVGVGIPGLYNARSGRAVTANLPATGRDIRGDILRAAGSGVVFQNDCNCFALSEATGGAGEGAGSVFGLILGTGVGGGYSAAGRLIADFNGAAGEVGHVGLPAALLAEMDLPVLRCGCGRQGCFETFLAGPGLSRLAEIRFDWAAQAPEIGAAAGAGDPRAEAVLADWTRLAAALIATLQATFDPECVVLGGGLSNMPGLAHRITRAVPDAILPHTEPPDIRLARFGDSSGTRGAAIAAVLAELEAG